MQPNAEMSSCQAALAIGLCILVCGCISEPPMPTNTEPTMIIRNVTFTNNTMDETSCYVMIDGECVDEEIRWK